MQQMTIRPHPPDHPQVDLFGGTGGESVQVHRLFFALLPEEGDAPAAPGVSSVRAALLQAAPADRRRR